ncbi:MAG TPA: site-2 protease family protein [Longimicrobiales bacterium]
MEIVLILPVLVFSIVVHEYAHGWAALRQGDPTAQMLGRLTLHPVPHIDPVGSILVPLLLWLAPGGLLFGWAKPVPVNPRNFRNYRRGDIIVSLAGVTANFLLAVAFTVAAVLLVYLGRLVPQLGAIVTALLDMARIGVWINLILVFFNLIPIPPLDGSHVLYHLLPARIGARYREFGRYGVLILLVVMLPFGRPLLQLVLWPVFALNALSETFIRLVT